MVLFKWKVLKFLGIERLVWNLEWFAGRWNYLDVANLDSVNIARQYARHGSILELGCGSGALANAIGSAYFKAYTGVDISNVAIRRANARRVDKAKFVVQAMENYEIAPVDLIIIQEALFYLEPRQQTTLLNNCLSQVAPNGFVYITVHDADEFEPLLIRARNAGLVVEDRIIQKNNKKFSHLVITPHNSSRA